MELLMMELLMRMAVERADVGGSGRCSGGVLGRAGFGRTVRCGGQVDVDLDAVCVLDVLEESPGGLVVHFAR